MGAPPVARKHASRRKFVRDGDLRKLEVAGDRYGERYDAYVKAGGLQELVKAVTKKDGVDTT